MLTFTFKVLSVQKYSYSNYIWIETDAPKNDTNNRFFVKDSVIWKVGNTIQRTVERVSESEQIEMPDTVYTRTVHLYRISHKLINEG
jgi:hypothetical protein